MIKKEKKREKERREQSNQKTNPPVITSTKYYTKKKKNRQTETRTNGKSKGILTISHKEAYTYTLTKREKGAKIYLYIK